MFTELLEQNLLSYKAVSKKQKPAFVTKMVRDDLIKRIEEINKDIENKDDKSALNKKKDLLFLCHGYHSYLETANKAPALRSILHTFITDYDAIKLAENTSDRRKDYMLFDGLLTCYKNDSNDPKPETTAKIKKFQNDLREIDRKDWDHTQFIEDLNAFISDLKENHLAITLRKHLKNIVRKQTIESVATLGFDDKLQQKLVKYKCSDQRAKKPTIKALEDLTQQLEKINRTRDPEKLSDLKFELLISCCKYISEFQKTDQAPMLTRILKNIIEFPDAKEIIEANKNQFDSINKLKLGAKTLTKLSPVTIYIWRPYTEFLIGDVGHVAIKTENEYISFWPNLDTDQKNYKSGIKSVNHTYLEDLLYEGRDPEYKITLYNLNAELIEEAYAELRTLKWGAYSCDKSCHKKSESRNCGSMAAQLLTIGGFDGFKHMFPNGVKIPKNKPKTNPQPTKGTNNKVPTTSFGPIFNISEFSAFIGVSFWEGFSFLHKRIVPANMADPLLEAARDEKLHNGKQIETYRQELIAKKHKNAQRIKNASGIDLKSVISLVKNDFIMINHILHSAAAKFNLHTAGMDYDQRTKMRDALHEVLKEAMIQYKLLAQAPIIDAEEVYKIFESIMNFYSDWADKIIDGNLSWGEGKKPIREILLATTQKLELYELKALTSSYAPGFFSTNNSNCSLQSHDEESDQLHLSTTQSSL